MAPVQSWRIDMHQFEQRNEVRLTRWRTAASAAVIVAGSSVVGAGAISLIRELYTWIAHDPAARLWIVGAVLGGIVGIYCVTRTGLLLPSYSRRGTTDTVSVLATGRAVRRSETVAADTSPVPEAPIPHERRADVALHEAAHAVAAVSFGMKVIEIQLARHYDATGITSAGSVRTDTYLSVERPDASPVAHWWGGVVVALSGSAMDRARGHSGWPGIEDMDRARTFAEVLYRYHAPLPDGFSASSVDDLLSHGIDVANQLVFDNRTSIEALAEALLGLSADHDGQRISGEPLNAALDRVTPHIATQ